MAQKRVGIAYLLWFIGGLFGLHHFYLGRDRQAFVWFCTFGGFGIGWLRDWFYITEYVALANEDPEYLERMKNYQLYYSFPPWCPTRFCGELLVASGFAGLIFNAVPDEMRGTLLSYLLVMVIPFEIAVGTHTVANIGLQQCSFKYPLIGAYIYLPLLFERSGYFYLCCLSSAIAVSWGRRWRPLRRDPTTRRSVCERLSTLAVCGFIFVSLCSSSFYFNATIMINDGDEVKVRQVLLNFFKSPAWLETDKIWRQLMDDALLKPPWNEIKMKEDLIESLDPHGEYHAFKVLGLDSSATTEDITARYRSLSELWRPDRRKHPEAKTKAQDKFNEIQEAFDIIMKRKKRAAEANFRKTEHKYY